MNFLALLFVTVCFLKAFYYGKYEKNNNVLTGSIFCTLSVISYIFFIIMLFKYNY